MSAQPFLPVPEDHLTVACETVRRRLAPLPFVQDGIPVTRELVRAALECLNSECTKTLPLPGNHASPGHATGLDQCLASRPGLRHSAATASVIAEVFCRTGIAEKTRIPDRQYRAGIPAVRLLPPWTWHIASVPVYPAVPAGETPGHAPAPWMNLCPVCRTGILSRVTGKVLFGILPTDYYLECTHCGAKFMPEGGEFRLVSIATIRDPLYKTHLNKAYPPDRWSAIARGTPPGKKQPGSGSAPRCQRTDGRRGDLVSLRDGSIGIHVPGQTLYFRPVRLTLSGRLRDNLFAKEPTPLRTLLDTPSYASLRETVEERYARYLSLPVGVFLRERKEKQDPGYRGFLNPYGDEKFGTFTVEDTADTRRSGVYIVVAGGDIIHAGCCPGTLREGIEEGFGRILARDCYRDGNATRCRINALICAGTKDTGVYIHPATGVTECRRIAGAVGAGAPVSPA